VIFISRSNFLPANDVVAYLNNPMIEFRPYIPEYFSIAESIFDSNTPEFVHPDEKKDLYKFLSEEVGDVHYSILFVDGKGAGMCGYHVDEQKNEGTLCWGLLHRDYHGRRLGEVMLLHRIAEMRNVSPNIKIKCRTSQVTEAFFAKYGFVTVYSEDNFWGEGLHLRTMELLSH
jgi:[ribosomal protein S18]-alanine N-acetyltransferase